MKNPSPVPPKTQVSLRARESVAGSNLQHTFQKPGVTQRASTFDLILTDVFRDKIPFPPHLTDKGREPQGCEGAQLTTSHSWILRKA